MSRYWSAVVQGLTPYVPGEQPKIHNLLKLNTNENPYGPSFRALEAIRAAAADGLRRYPDPESDALRQALASYHGLQREQVFVGNGSDEVLAHAFQALLKHDDPLLFPDITYSFYPTYCGLYGIKYETVPLDTDFRIQPRDYLPTARSVPAGGIILPNPNAPTGIALTLEQIDSIVSANPQAVVVVDEAYVDFGAESAVSLLSRHQNLLVVHTFSKSRALAGLRVGYAVGHPALIEALSRVKNSFNSYPLDTLAQAGAMAALQDEAHFRKICAAIQKSRGLLVDGLQQQGFVVLPSSANFVFARHPKRSGVSLAAALREHGIIVRNFGHPRIEHFLRITVGQDAECRRLLDTLGEILAQ